MKTNDAASTRILLVNLGAPQELIQSLTRLLHRAGRLSIENVLLEAVGGSWTPSLESGEAPSVILVCLPENGLRQAGLVTRGIRTKFPESTLVFVREAERLHLTEDMLSWGGLAFGQETKESIAIAPSGASQPEAKHDETTPAQLKERLGLKQFVGESALLLDVLRTIAKMACHDVGVLIGGETGTGKEMVARAIHQLSHRKGKPFVPVNCGAIPFELVENELFGHQAGAFTGASAAATGVIHDAERGSLFLDEIDSLPMPSQAKLLRLLQEKEYRPLGSHRVVKADIRVIAASNADFQEAIRHGRFRSDLFYRLSAFPLLLPPLRKRKEDIPLHCAHLLSKFASDHELPVKSISNEALRKLVAYDWPGNVRELENVLEHALILSERPFIAASDIDLPLMTHHLTGDSFKAQKARAVEEFERRYIQELLVAYHGNIAQSARAAQKNRRAFWELIHKYRIDVRKGSAP